VTETSGLAADSRGNGPLSQTSILGAPNPPTLGLGSQAALDPSKPRYAEALIGRDVDVTSVD